MNKVYVAYGIYIFVLAFIISAAILAVAFIIHVGLAPLMLGITSAVTLLVVMDKAIDWATKTLKESESVEKPAMPEVPGEVHRRND